MIPAALKKQLPPESNERFVINRGFEKHLVLYPQSEWAKITSGVNTLNPFVEANRIFQRNFYRGATELTLDSGNRILLPKTLIDYASLQKDVVVFAYINKIEIWSEESYEKQLSPEPENMAKLAEEVMKNFNPGGNVS